MSSTDYNYDEQVLIDAQTSRLSANLRKGQFFPFFILTVTGIVTLPLTYSLLKPNKGLRPPWLPHVIRKLMRFC